MSCGLSPPFSYVSLWLGCSLCFKGWVWLSQSRLGPASLCFPMAQHNPASLLRNDWPRRLPWLRQDFFFNEKKEKKIKKVKTLPWVWNYPQSHLFSAHRHTTHSASALSKPYAVAAAGRVLGDGFFPLQQASRNVIEIYMLIHRADKAENRCFSYFCFALQMESKKHKSLSH